MSEGQKIVGTIFMGPQEERETTLERLYESSRQEIWTKQTEQEYMERVKAKAADRVRALLAQARRRGEEILAGAAREAEAIRAEAGAMRHETKQALDEAESLRGQAVAQRDAGRQEGFAQGHAEVMAQLAEARKSLGEASAVVLLGIHEQCGTLFEGWRGAMADLLIAAVEKSTGLVVDKDRAAMLRTLLDQSMRALLDRSRYTVKVHPDDAALLTDMLADAHQANARSANWELATDPALAPGSLIVESSTALINNSREARQSVVDEVLRHLSLPQGPLDQEAFGAVTACLVDGLRKNGVDFSQSGEEGQNAGPHPDPVPDCQPAGHPGEPPAGHPGEPPAGHDAPRPEPLAAAAPVPPVPPVSEEKPPPVPDRDIPDPVSALSAPDAPAPESPAPGAPAPDVPGAAPAPDAPAPDAPAHVEPAAADAAADHEQLAQTEAQDLVEEFLGGPLSPADEAAPPPREVEGEQTEAESPGLPPDVADDLLAEMGFGDKP